MTHTTADARLATELRLRTVLCREGARVYAVQYGSGAVALYVQHPDPREGLLDITATVAETLDWPTMGGRLKPATDALCPADETMWIIEALSKHLHGFRYALRGVRL